MDTLETRRNREARSNVSEPLRETASQTAGPYVHIGCLPVMSGIEGVYPADMLNSTTAAAGDRIRITGQVFEGDAVVCKDMLLETWQADANGDYATGIWRRTWTDSDSGIYTLDTVRPGAVTDANGQRFAPFISVWVVARGINIGLLTRLYFEDEADANSGDPHLALVDPMRRATLIATSGSNRENGEYRFDVHLQGDHETVFIDA